MSRDIIPFTITVAPRQVIRLPGVLDGEAHLEGTEVPVWTLIALWDGGASDDQVLQAYPVLNRTDLHQARAYAATHHVEIRQAIREHRGVAEEAGLLMLRGVFGR